MIVGSVIVACMIVAAVIVACVVVARVIVAGSGMTRAVMPAMIIVLVHAAVIGSVASTTGCLAVMPVVITVPRRSHSLQCNHSRDTPEAGARDPYICLKRCA
jgi:hypothetical protein